MYDVKIANDIKIDGRLPKTPRIFGSQLSPIWNVIDFFLDKTSAISIA